MIKELLYKWFGLETPRCPTCEVLQIQLDAANRERERLLHTLLWAEKIEVKPPVQTNEELKPVLPQYIPWRVKQQMYEAEDRRKAELMRAKQKEMAETKTPVSESVAKLEEELGIKEA